MRKIAVLFTLLFVFNLYAGFSLKDLGSGKKYFKNAEKLFNQGKYAQAITFYQKFLAKKKNENNEKALYHISVSFMEIGMPDKGFPYIKKLYDLKGTNLKYAILYAEYLVQLNKLRDAINVYKKIVSNHPDDYLSYVRLGELFVNDGQLDKAREMWLKAVKLNEKPVEAYSLLSESYLNVEKNKLMAYYYARKLLDVAPSDRREEIEQMLDSIAGDFKEDFEQYYLLKTCKENAKNYIDNGDYKSAYNSLEKCEDADNVDKEYLLMFAKVCKKLDNYKKAIEIYKKCLALGLESGEIYLELAKCYLKTGNRELAKANLKLAAKYPKVKNKALKLLNSI